MRGHGIGHAAPGESLELPLSPPTNPSCCHPSEYWQNGADDSSGIAGAEPVHARKSVRYEFKNACSSSTFVNDAVAH